MYQHTNYKSLMNIEGQQLSTKLSKYVRKLKDRSDDYTTDWNIKDRPTLYMAIQARGVNCNDQKNFVGCLILRLCGQRVSRETRMFPFQIPRLFISIE